MHQYNSFTSDHTAEPVKDEPVDPLFLERLQSFLERSMSELRAFAEREGADFYRTRRRVAEWHSKWLFGVDRSSKASGSRIGTDRHHQPDPFKVVYKNALHHISDSLESLNVITSNDASTSISSTAVNTPSPSISIQSFFLAVDPTDPQDDGFLGGSIVGREFWRGLKGGGTGGARAFKMFCHTSSLARPFLQAPAATLSSTSRTPEVASLQDVEIAEESGLVNAAASGSTAPLPLSASFKRTPAIALKSELYATVRDALRTTSGHRTAEMKWTNHQRLTELYNITLEGWPSDTVPHLNPSKLNSTQNRALLEGFRSGGIRFVRLESGDGTGTCGLGEGEGIGGAGQEENRPVAEASEDISWALAQDEGDEDEGDIGSSEGVSSTSRKRVRLE